MDGLIVREPYASQLIAGVKDTECRSTPLPADKQNRKIVILNKAFAIGTVVFSGHTYDRLTQTYQWNVEASEEYSPRIEYERKQGCAAWVKDVRLNSNG